MDHLKRLVLMVFIGAIIASLIVLSSVFEPVPSRNTREYDNTYAVVIPFFIAGIPIAIYETMMLPKAKNILLEFACFTVFVPLSVIILFMVILNVFALATSGNLVDINPDNISNYVMALITILLTSSIGVVLFSAIKKSLIKQ